MKTSGRPRYQSGRPESNESIGQQVSKHKRSGYKLLVKKSRRGGDQGAIEVNEVDLEYLEDEN